MVLQATVQRASIYDDSASQTVREQFRVGLRQHLDESLDAYRHSASDADHFERVQQFADSLSEQHSSALHDGRFRIGAAQKALNLFLKYQWCSHVIEMPPHCPFDAVIIAELPTGLSNQLDDA